MASEKQIVKLWYASQIWLCKHVLYGLPIGFRNFECVASI